VFLALKEKLFGHRASKSVAKSRLHFVLVQDRTGLTNEELAKFKEEMVSVIEKYFVIDKTGFDISYKRNGETTTLFINSPIIVKRQDSPGSDVGARKQKGKRKIDKEIIDDSEDMEPVEIPPGAGLSGADSVK
jgi:cell division topological specificity factor